jgi:hypothetical protein
VRRPCTAGRRQIGEQLAAGQPRQGGRIRGRDDQALRAARSVRTHHDFQRPLGFAVSIAKGSLDRSRVPAILWSTPDCRARCLLYPVDRIHRRPPGARRAQSQDITDAQPLQAGREAGVLAVERIGDGGPKRESVSYSLLDQLQGKLRLGSLGGIARAAAEVAAWE